MRLDTNIIDMRHITYFFDFCYPTAITDIRLCQLNQDYVGNKEHTAKRVNIRSPFAKRNVRMLRNIFTGLDVWGIWFFKCIYIIFFSDL